MQQEEERPLIGETIEHVQSMPFQGALAEPGIRCRYVRNGRCGATLSFMNTPLTLHQVGADCLYPFWEMVLQIVRLPPDPFQA